jgi:hypothetical protein
MVFAQSDCVVGVNPTQLLAIGYQTGNISVGACMDQDAFSLSTEL